MLNRPEYQQHLASLEAKHGLPQGILIRMRMTESTDNDAAVSKKGAAGGFGMMPGTSKMLGVNPNDPYGAAGGAARYLSQLYRQFGSWPAAVAAYNWGPGNIAKYGLGAAPLETRNYLNKVL